MMVQTLVETFAVADIGGFLELSRSEYGPAVLANPDHIRWKHLDSPFGASVYVCLAVSGRVVGRALLQPRPMHTALQKLNAAHVTDVLIDREFRSPPTNFINVTKTSGEVSGFDLVYHTSNERTDPLYSRLLRFPKPFCLQGYGFPLRLAGFFSLLIGRRIVVLDWFTAPLRWLFGIIAVAVNFAAKLDISPQAIDDDALAVLCTKCSHQSGPLFARTNAFLKWRFTDAPLWSAAVHRVDHDGLFLGYVVTRNVNLGGLNHFVLMDFMLDPEMPILLQIALRLWLIRSAIASKVDTIFTMVNSFNSLARKCAGFPLVSIPDRLLPHTTPIFIRSRSNESKELEGDRSIHMTLADLDYF